jgi:hypothetical protein
MDNVSQPEFKKMSSWQKGRRMAKSAFAVLKLDKELLLLPMLSMVVTLSIVVFGFLGVLATTPGGMSFGDGQKPFVEGTGEFTWIQGVLLALVGLAAAIAGSIFNGALIHGVLTRFRGENPSVSSSFRGAIKRFRPLAVFTLITYTVGMVIQTLAEKIPYFGAQILSSHYGQPRDAYPIRAN